MPGRVSAASCGVLRAGRVASLVRWPASAGTRSSPWSSTTDAGPVGRTRPPWLTRRTSDGFVVALAFGAHVDWYRNLVVAGEGRIRWRGKEHPVGQPESVDADTALAAFHPVQRLALRIGGIDGFIRLPDGFATR